MLLIKCPNFKYAMNYSSSDEIVAIRELFNILSMRFFLSHSYTVLSAQLSL